MKEEYKLSEIAGKRLEESNLKIDQDNSKLSMIGEMALYSTIPDKDGKSVRLDGVDSNNIHKIEKIVQDDDKFENFKREMNLARLCNINDRLPRMLSLGHDDFHVFGVDLIDRDRVGVLIKHEETEDNNIKLDILENPKEQDIVNMLIEEKVIDSEKYNKLREEKKEQAFIDAVNSINNKEQDQGLIR